MKTILVTNDDGICGVGLKPLIYELKKIAKVVTVVPDRERSGTSHSITLNKPLHMSQIEKGIYTLDGTPADCVRFGSLYLAKGKVNLIVSGINTGPNLGEDVVYSGTVAGSREGALLGIPSFAVSIHNPFKGDFKVAARIARKLAKKLFTVEFPKNIFLNVNVPTPYKGIKITSLGKRIYSDDIECRIDPRGKKYYWLSGEEVKGENRRGTDIEAVSSSYVSVTPMVISLEAAHMFGLFKKWIKSLN